ncbi:hypothetical protein METBIDRAFT_35511 [Metschnikowia bicuspidata var. bicuspidata NRRL YB-4993]|uniref:RRM domain-containing protein n=1 Tax=Metschnikowia bicuspidata var. bicuspidata NRRL YB-4993 TaxID=869754 RepID=A0A1A0HGZ0_9ASCO|nr:hypothetical protein METBIDRAFT_35511 [Metschnikowia bicuspidata var. bicuspidata NRRL YB-4993]OBA23444.1 hypothetical protein METBIDRAFT_35511 [Metschnikowia bicuspidata var. bicuspidata NRRL YB-4993]
MNDRRPFRYENERGPREQRRENVKSEPPADPDAKLSKEELITKYERRLIGLLRVPTIDKFPVLGSQWGIKPKGFEKVTAQRAKLSGLFPLPGSPRPVDVTKLEGLIKDGCTENGILLASSKIDPLDSRNSCIVIIKGIDFLKVDHLIVAEYINKFIGSADIKGVSIGNNIERKRKTKDDSKLIIEFKTSVAATLALTLNGQNLPAASFNTSGDVILQMSRPGEYVVQCLPPYNSPKDEIDDEVLDSPRKITLTVDKAANESSLIDALNKIAPIRAFQYVREVGTKDPIGVAFLEFYIDAKSFPNTKSALKQTMVYLKQTEELDMVIRACFSCLKVSGENVIETSIQDCPIELKTLKGLVRNEYVAFHPKLKVIQLINVVTAADLTDEESFRFIEQDIQHEANSFGKVVSMKIPRPPHDYSAGILQLTQPGIGKIYIEFESEQVALSALMSMAGRSYNDRTVLCAFYSHEDYANGLF